MIESSSRRASQATSQSSDSTQNVGCMKKTENSLGLCINKVFLKAFLLTFLGEWGDKSQLGTISLAATNVWENIEKYLHKKCAKKNLFSLIYQNSSQALNWWFLSDVQWATLLVLDLQLCLENLLFRRSKFLTVRYFYNKIDLKFSKHCWRSPLSWIFCFYVLQRFHEPWRRYCFRSAWYRMQLTYLD